MNITPVGYLPELDFQSEEFIEEGSVDTELYSEDDQSIIRNFNLIPVYCQEDVNFLIAKINDLEETIRVMREADDALSSRFG